jgi:hypothetical protein
VGGEPTEETLELPADVCVYWRLKKSDTDATVTCQRKRIRDRDEDWAGLGWLLEWWVG